MINRYTLMVAQALKGDNSTALCCCRSLCSATLAALPVVGVSFPSCKLLPHRSRQEHGSALGRAN